LLLAINNEKAEKKTKKHQKLYFIKLMYVYEKVRHQMIIELSFVLAIL